MIMPVIRRKRLIRANEKDKLGFLHLHLRMQECIAEEELSKYIPYLSERELQKIERLYRNPRRQAMMAKARFYAKWIAAAEYSGFDRANMLELKEFEVLNKETESKRPFILYQGKELENSISISYCEKDIFLGLSRNCRIGIDIEAEVPTTQAFMESVFSLKEIAFIRNGAFGLNEKQRALLIWCLKEAILKALGLGFSKGYNTVELCVDQESNEIKILDHYKLCHINNGIQLYYDIQPEICAVVCIIF